MAPFFETECTLHGEYSIVLATVIHFLNWRLFIHRIVGYSIALRMRCALRTPVHYNLLVEFYLYPTVGTVLIHSVKPELTE